MSAKQLVNLNKVQDYHSILICFHWVGGNGFSYRKLAMTLAAHGILVYGYALVENSLNPANKKQQTRPKSVQEAATNFIQCLEQQMNAHPSDGISLFNPLNKAIHLFGHSYGGMIAYEAMRMLHQTKQQACHLNKIEKLIVSCVRSPTDLSRYNQSRVNPNYLLSDAALVKEIVRIGGLPVGVDEQFIWLGLPAIRSDFSAFESYQLSGGCNDDVKLSCPIVKIAAVCDEFVSSQDTDGWNQYSDQYIRYELQGASHFYLSEERCLHALMGILCQEVL